MRNGILTSGLGTARAYSHRAPLTRLHTPPQDPQTKRPPLKQTDAEKKQENHADQHGGRPLINKSPEEREDRQCGQISHLVSTDHRCCLTGWYITEVTKEPGLPDFTGFPRRHYHHQTAEKHDQTCLEWDVNV